MPQRCADICSACAQDIMIGDECTAARDMLETSYPISNGIVTNWEDMTHLCAVPRVPAVCACRASAFTNRAAMGVRGEGLEC